MKLIGGKIRLQLLYDLKETRECCRVKQEALDGNLENSL